MRALILAGLCLLSLSALVNAEEPLQAIGEPVVYLVMFRSGNAELTDDARTVLDAAVREYWTQSDTAESVTMHIRGHYDTSGTARYAEQISQKMAENVRDYLISAGVPAGALRVSWSGEREPAVPTRDGVAEPYNRRVEITFFDPPS